MMPRMLTVDEVKERALQEECDRYAESASRVGVAVSGAEVRALFERFSPRPAASAQQLQILLASLEQAKPAQPAPGTKDGRATYTRKAAYRRRSLKERRERKRRSKQRRQR